MECRSPGSIGVILLFTAVILLHSGGAMAIEEPKFELIEQVGDFELRKYEPYIVAETLVEGEFAEVGDQGFRRLAGYIFGKNRKKQSIDMTAPVNMESSSETIAMTAPVNQQVRDGRWRITFTMPAQYSMESLPVPLDERVVLKQEPGRLMAALRYSGSWSQKLYLEKVAMLKTFLEKREIQSAGEPIFARYNSPFSLWFLRRNEILIPIKSPETQA